MLRSVLLLPVALAALTAASQRPPPPPPTARDAPFLPETTSGELLHLHRKLVGLESVTGDEQHIGLWLAAYLRDRNFTVELHETAPRRYNVLAYGEKRETSILVSSHIDTVPPYWPYFYNETSGIIGGRGSVDAKASVAAQIVAVEGLRAHLYDEISLLFVVGEETGGDGMRHFSNWNERPPYDIVIFGEPTEGKLVCGHKGILGFTLSITGKAAHSGYPWLGVSANDVLVEALAKLLELREQLPWSEKYGNTTMNFGRIVGGVASNVVAETASAEITVRLAAGTPGLVQSMVIDALKDVKTTVEALGGDLDVRRGSEGYPPVNINCDIEGFEKMTVNYGTDVPNLKGNHKRYLYGPGSIFVAHSDHEALKREELEHAVLDYRKIIIAASKMDHQDQDEL
ncbi:hypothetical protein BDV95DRAFT_483398 [Massariosphaeria phaeospora]|uniref:Peptide hydrolase n=1 Tax=Massariosphaeria phaeospora TaxID=100035 RepID=A0A7C8MEW9_9PLEO|nr:hypothetical protein BDV95DRAFT_483398 [Massariosphaeria phaeospora]